MMCVDPHSREVVRDAILDYIAGLPQEALAPAIIEFFAGVTILDEIEMEEWGFRKCDPTKADPVPPEDRNRDDIPW
jgi:hypothetical protein